ncbi:MAG TPA: IS110 family transposase [Candidatus Dormibacteraeota bacterium]|nr:IS110 family transposase [Candidatus Dormibacteraeota bacterium]
MKKGAGTFLGNTNPGDCGERRKIRLEERSGQAASARPQPGTAVYLAVDLSRTKWVYCARWGGAEQRRLSTPAGLEHWQALVAQYADTALHVTYEACGFGYEAAWWLQAQQLAVTVIAPSRVERAPGLAVKTDRLDVGKMARKLEERQLKGIYIPARGEHEWRQVARTYAQAVQERQRAQVRVRSLLQEQGRLDPAPQAGWSAYASWVTPQALPAPVARCLESLLEVRASADRQVQRLKGPLAEAAALPAYRAVVTALREQPGVGPLAAIRFVLELGSITRFRSPAALAHYLGVTPSEYSSGALVQRGHVLKCGPALLRATLLQCAWVAIRHDAALRQVFERLAPRLGRKRAIVAVARRLAEQLWHRWRAALAAPAPGTAT